MRLSRRLCTLQRDLIPRSMTAQIPLGCHHPLVQAADSLDWEEIQRVAQEIRRAKLKNAAGRPPRLRATLGAVLFMALRKRPYRETLPFGFYYPEDFDIPFIEPANSCVLA